MCVSPAILLLLIITFSFELIKRFIGYIRWGGEFIIMNKDDRKYIDDIFKLLKEEVSKNSNAPAVGNNEEAEYCSKCGKRIKMKDGTIELLCECSEVTVCPRYYQCFNPCKSKYCTLETVSLNGCFVGQTVC